MPTDPPPGGSRDGPDRHPAPPADTGKAASLRAGGPISAAWQNCRPRRIKSWLCAAVPALSILMFVSLAGLLVTAASFFWLYPSGGLFVLSAETTRLDYEASGQARGEIWVDGVLVRAGTTWVVDTSKYKQVPEREGGPDQPPTVLTLPEYFCYSGFVRPAAGARVELAFLRGTQIMRITPDPKKEGATSATLSFEQQDLALTARHDTRPDPRPEPEANALMLAPLDGDEGVEPGAFKLDSSVELYADPGCEVVAQGAQGFGIGGQAITIEGPAILGRKLRHADEKDLVDDDIPILRGTVEVIIRQVLCIERLKRAFNKEPQRYGGGCERIYRIEAEPIALPPGSTLLSRTSEPAHDDVGVIAPPMVDKPALFYGQVEFRDGVYVLNASTEADRFIILRPGAGGTLRDGNALSVPFIDRILLEPWLILFASAFFALSGLVLGILQVEDED